MCKCQRRMSEIEDITIGKELKEETRVFARKVGSGMIGKE